jgi:hypothetical protein
MTGSRRLALGLMVASAVLIAVSAGFLIAGLRAGLRPDQGGSLWDLVSILVPITAFAAVGGLIGLRQPGNRIGWLLAAIGLLFAIVAASSAATIWVLKASSLPDGVGEWVSVPASVWVIALSLIGTQLPLRLPDGELPSPRWRWFSRATIVLIALALVGMAVQPGRVDGVAGTQNPLASESLKALTVAFLFVILSFVAGLVALVRRYRRASTHDRAQLRWIAFGGVVFLGVYFVTLLSLSIFGENSTAGEVATSFSQAAFAALPISIGYAVLRHRLYDIDAVISRTLGYALLTATLAGTYLGLVLLLQLVVSPSSDLAVAGSTLAVAAVFRPLRGRIQALVDRRFYRRGYDAARTLEGFGARLRDQVDLDSLGGELRSVVAETMQPAHVSLWVRPR